MRGEKHGVFWLTAFGEVLCTTGIAKEYAVYDDPAHAVMRMCELQEADPSRNYAVLPIHVL